MTLKDVAKINIGVTISRLPKPPDKSSSKTYNYFTLSSAEYDQTIDKTKLKQVQTTGEIDQKFISKKGDIIIGLSSPYSLAIIGDDFSGIIIPSQFALIRVTRKNILPEYLIAYLASDDIFSKLQDMERGVLVKRIDLTTLNSLPLYLPPISKQQKIANLRAMIKEENSLNYQYAKLTEQKNNYYLNKLVTPQTAVKTKSKGATNNE